MKIAYIVASQIPSMKANSIQVMKVCQALTQNGNAIHLYVPGEREVPWEELKSLYGVHDQFPIKWIPAIKCRSHLDFILRSLINAKKTKCTVIYTRMVWTAWCAIMINFPVIFEIHDIPVGRMGTKLFKSYLNSRKRKLTVFITRALQRKIEDQYQMRFSDQNMIAAPDGVDLDRYTSIPDAKTSRNAIGLPERITAAYSGGFYPGRGVDLLLKLAESFPEVQFLWIGGDKAAVLYWEEKITEAGIKNVVLTGFIPNELLPLYQAAADIQLMPFGRIVSGSSGGNTADVCSPMKMFEYMATGRAILASDLPVLREVLSEENAFFYRPDDMESLTSQFELLLNDHEKRERLAVQARLDVEPYDWKNRMRRIMKAAVTAFELLDS